MKDFSETGIFPFKLDKNARTQIWAFVVPLVVALSCFFMQWHLRRQALAQCTVRDREGFLFDITDVSGDLFWDLTINNIPCASGGNQLFYKCLGVIIYVCLGLAVMLPIILYLRQQPVEQTKLFE